MGWIEKKRAARNATDRLRSKFEQRLVDQLREKGVDYVYEKQCTWFTPPPKRTRKTWDFWITTKSGKEIVIEGKGWWKPKRRIAELECIKQHPEIDVRYVFENAETKIRKGSKTSYADVCRKHGILFAQGRIPQEWLDE
jgi:hypothetical protein